MWWRSELERVEQESELLLRLLIREVADAEDPLLELDIVDSDGSGSNSGNNEPINLPQI